MKNKFTLMKVLLVLLAFVAAGVIYTLVSSKSSAEAETQTIVAETAETDTESVTAADFSVQETTVQICVHVCGAVVNEGVYYLDEGSRVHQAIELAGGMTENAASSYVNLADVVTDGMQLYVPSKEEVESGTFTNPASAGLSASSADDGLININTATLQELTTLTGIGESKAEAIISYRENVSLFNSIEDITNVSGIGSSVFEKIKDNIKV